MVLEYIYLISISLFDEITYALNKTEVIYIINSFNLEKKQNRKKLNKPLEKKLIDLVNAVLLKENNLGGVGLQCLLAFYALCLRHAFTNKIYPNI